MSTMASQNTSLTIVYSTVNSGADQRKHQSSASLAFVSGIHRSPVNSPHNWPVTRKMFPFDDVIMYHDEIRVLTRFHCTKCGRYEEKFPHVDGVLRTGYQGTPLTIPQHRHSFIKLAAGVNFDRYLSKSAPYVNCRSGA